MAASHALPILLLPGLDGTGLFLADLGDQLTRTRPTTIIAYPPDRLLAYPDLVDFVRSRLPEGRFVVLGESFSGPIAVEIAARLPDRVAGLILAASFVRRPVPVGDTLARAWLCARLPRVRPIVSAGLFGRFATPKLTQLLQIVLDKVPHRTFAFRIGEIMHVDKQSRLADVCCPFLYLHGKRDIVVRRGSMQNALRSARDGAAAEIDGPHAFLTTHVAESAAAIESFAATLP